MDAVLRFRDLLEVLARHEVDFILVGGVAAILEGAPVSTFDLDIVLNPTGENLDRLLAALHQVNARYLDPAGRQIQPDADKMATFRIHRLLTDYGPLDVMRSIGRDLDYGALVGHTRIYDMEGLEVRTLNLEMIIESKEQARRDKDQMALPVLRRTLALKRSPSKETPPEEG